MAHEAKILGADFSRQDIKRKVIKADRDPAITDDTLYRSAGDLAH
jgi:hypothetical protein